MVGFSENDTSYSVVVKACWNDFYPNVIRDNQMSYQYEENEILLTDFRQV